MERAAKDADRSQRMMEMRNAVNTLYANVRFMEVDGPLRSIVVTSSIPNEGKSTVALVLAESMAASGKRTLLVECDLRRRTLAAELNVHAPCGLCSVVLGDAGLSEAIVETDRRNLFFLDAEPNVTCPADILGSARFRRMLSAVERSFDYTVIDTPPVGTFVDAAVVAAASSATALVVRENVARRADVVKARDQLEKAGANLVGIVMSCCELENSRYYYEHYVG